MKHTIEYDLENPLDAARFELSSNMMLIMSELTYMLGGIKLANDELKAKTYTPDQFVMEVNSLHDKLQDALYDVEASFWYIAKDGKCDECIAQDEIKE